MTELEEVKKKLNRNNKIASIFFVAFWLLIFPSLIRWLEIYKTWNEEECGYCPAERACVFGPGIIGVQKCSVSSYDRRTYWQKCDPDPEFNKASK